MEKNNNDTQRNLCPYSKEDIGEIEAIGTSTIFFTFLLVIVILIVIAVVNNFSDVNIWQKMYEYGYAIFKVLFDALVQFTDTLVQSVKG